MRITTKYDVGYEFYVPRVIVQHEKETIIHPDEFGTPQEFSRTVPTLVAIARPKKVDYISIEITDTESVIKYYCVTVGQDDCPRAYKEEDMCFTSMETALAFAREWRNTQQCEYFG